MKNTLETYSRNAVARYAARHCAADDVQWNCAAFDWNCAIRRFEIVVCGYVVATVRTVNEVRTFCAMHNARIA